jgi:negative regulator of sigma E activity
VSRFGPAYLVNALLGAALIVLVLPAPLAAATSKHDDSDEAIGWLQRAAAAPERVSFRATQFVTSWGPQGASSALLEILNAAEQGSQISVLGAGASNGVKAFMQRAGHNGGPAVDGGPLSLLTSTYDVQLAGGAEIIGRPTVLVEARRPDRTLAARFWIDRATGLLLQRHLFTMDGRDLVRATVYTTLRIERGDFLSHLPPTLPDPSVESLGTGGAGQLRAEGWNCADRLPDSLKLYGVHRDAEGSVQLSYSDGLFTVSVFEQRGRLDPAALAGYTATTTTDGAPVYVRYGMPSYAVWSSDGIVYTLVGDIPYDVMARVVAAFPHDVPDPAGAIDRIGNGLAKMTRWLTPAGAFAAKLG